MPTPLRKLRIPGLILLGLIQATGLPVAASVSRPAWPEIRRQIAERFPQVAGLTTAELARWLGDRTRVQPVIIDVRTREEYAVSHLPGAVQAETGREQRAVLAGLPVDRPVVFYCSVGWRSAQAAERWRRAGRTAVLNLDGSIFQWANEGRPLVRAGRPVTVVHPFDTVWGQLLDRRRWVRDISPSP